MNKLPLLLFTLLSFFTVLLSGCSTLNKNQHRQITKQQSITERTKKLSTLTHWQIKGKMAIISPEERHSATLNWHYQGDKKRQTLNLTTILGIQVFNLESVNGMHVIEVDGKRLQGPDLNKLLASLTGFTLPTQAMTFWLKGLPYLASDKVIYHQSTQLPQTLISYYNQKKWQLKYADYRQVDQYQLDSKFTIQQAELTIKINVHKWNVTLND